MLRNLPVIEMAQTVGRVIRMHRDDRKAIAEGKMKAGEFVFYKKPCGHVVIPTNNNYGDRIIKQLQNVVDTIFVKVKFRLHKLLCVTHNIMPFTKKFPRSGDTKHIRVQLFILT